MRGRFNLACALADRIDVESTRKDNGHVVMVDADRERALEWAGWLEDLSVTCLHPSEWDARVAEADALIVHVAGEEGYVQVRQLRAHAPAVPILFVCKRAVRQADRVRALALGATDLLIGTPGAFELSQKVETLLSIHPVDGSLPGDVPDQLFAPTQGTRHVNEQEFETRVEWARSWASRFGLYSSLIALRGENDEELERILASLEGCLRVEDAVLVLDETTVLILLVAAPERAAGAVVRRAFAGDRRFAYLELPKEPHTDWAKLTAGTFAERTAGEGA